MGLLDRFRLASKVASRNPVAPIRSPWSSGQLSKVVWADIVGSESGPVTRAQAMQVPAIVKGRALICGTLSRQPLAKFRGENKIAPDAWMYRTSTGVSPQTRMLWTLDDLIFGGTSLWAVSRGSGGKILDASRIPPEWWTITPNLDVLVNDEPVNADEVILFEGPQDALLEIAAEDIRASLSMKRSWASRVDAPVPLVELHVTDAAFVMTDAEEDALIAAWEESRRRGGTALTPAEIETKIHGQTPTDLFVEGRNAARLDWANYLNLPAALMEGSMATATLTYSTTETKRNELVDYSLSYWSNCIASRLSLDDVTPAGTRTDFDIEWLTQAEQPTQGPTHED